jgi:hypothetical protein
MKRTVEAFFVVTSTTLMLATPCVAKNSDLPGSKWQDAKLGCLAIEKVSDPLSGSDECAQISGSLEKRGPMTGYACEQQSTIGFFAVIGESDNAIRPEFFVGSYMADTISVQNCFRVSNDWPPEFNCEAKAEFKKVSECAAQ